MTAGGAAPRPDGGPVVVVGAGVAGLTTALALAPVPCVVLATRGAGRGTSSAWAQGGIAAAVGADDDPALHAADTVAAGAGLCDPDVVRAVTAAGPEAVGWLTRVGARFDRTPDGDLRLGLEGAHGRRRIVHADGDGTGREVVRALVAAVRRSPSVTVLDGARAVRLTRDADGGVRGVVVERDGVVAELATRRVVLATGGVGGLYLGTTNPLGSRGQGLALALRAGATVRDVEMVQLHPTALDVGLDPMPLVSEAVRGAGARLVTADGRDLLADPLAPRDVVARAVDAAQRQGRRVLLDARALPGGDPRELFPGLAAACARAGLDPSTDPVPVRPAAHYHMGGVAVDLAGRTGVPGLWACGEVASTGLHGANRLASNSLLEAVVTGRWVAADVATTEPPVAAGRIPGDVGTPPAGRTGPSAAPWLRRLLADVAGVQRDGAALAAAVDRLERTVDGAGADAAADDVLVALAICRGALLRTESRGAHTRTDLPAADPARETDLLGADPDRAVSPRADAGTEPARHTLLDLDAVVTGTVAAGTAVAGTVAAGTFPALA